MRYVRLALLSFIFLFLVIWGLSLLIPAHIKLSKAINIKASRDSVSAMLMYPGNWKYWYPGMDSATPYVENGMVTGMILNKLDTSHPVYLKLINGPYDEFVAEFRGNNMNPVVNTWRLIEHQGSDSLTLQWSMAFHLRWYPWEKFASLALEKTYAPKMEQGLIELRKKVQGTH